MSKYKNRVVEFPKDRKELLDLKIRREIGDIEREGRTLILSLAKDFAGIITYGNFTEKEIETMLAMDKIILELVMKWQDSEVVMALQEDFVADLLKGD